MSLMFKVLAKLKKTARRKMRLYNASSPRDRGAADAYYERKPVPHKINSSGQREKDLTPEERRDYWRGYEEETSRKDWGE